MMDLRSFISISLTCVLLATLNAAQDDQASNGQTRPKFISELYGDYVKTEERLWQRIQAAQFQTSDAIIADIVNSHRNLFFDDTFESNSYWRSYLIFGIENLREHLSNINDTLENNCRFLFDGAEKIVYNPMDIEQWTRDAMFRRLRDNRNGLFDLTVRRNDTILQHIQTEAKSCIRYVEYVISEVQLVNEYYANVGKALLRSYGMTQLANMLITLSERSNDRVSDAQVERRFFIERFSQFRETINDMHQKASRDLWKCNPDPYFDRHDHYTAITNFMQGYIDNVINLNEENSCSKTCPDFKSTKNYQCQNGSLCAQSNFGQTRCSGEVFDCAPIDSDGKVCYTKDEWDVKLEQRRYNYVKFQNGSMNGHDVMCFKAEQNDLVSWSSWLVNKCNNCFCSCDEPGEKSDRYFGLREITSDITANKIITGIAFQKINRVIQLNVAERELLPFGKVNDTLRRSHPWKSDSSDLLRDGEDGLDYFTLTKERRSINLDTIRLPSDTIITGVRLQVQQNRLHLQVRGTKFDFKTGKLNTDEPSVWIKNGNDHTKLELVEPDAPTRTKNIQEIFDSKHKFIEFRSSDIKKDLAQVTVPYIETVRLEASEPRPLSGVGLFYKGEDGFGGYIAIKLVAYEPMKVL